MSNAIIACAAAFAVAISTISAGLGQGMAAKSAMESIARQPEKFSDIRSTLIVAMAFMETLVIYGLLIGFMLVGKIQ